MPRTLGAKDKKKRKRRRLTNIAIGVGGAAALGGLGLLALRKKMPKVGNTMRPVTPTVSTSTATRVSQSSTPIAARTPQISPASSPPPRVTQPDIPAKPKLIPSRAEIQTGSVIPPQPIQQPKTIKALPPSRSPQSPVLPTKPKLIPSRAEIQPTSIKALPPASTPKALPPSKPTTTTNPPTKRKTKPKPEVEVVKDTQQSGVKKRTKRKVVKKAKWNKLPKKRVQEQKSYTKRAAAWARRNNAAAMERKKNIAKLLIKKVTDEQGRKVTKAVLKRSPKLAGAAARIGVQAAKSVKLTRRQLLQAAGAGATVQGKKVAEEAIAKANPITRVNKAFKDVKQAAIEADKAADLLEKEGEKIISRREMLRRARQYALDYARARPGRVVKPVAKSAYDNLKNLADPVGLAKDLAKPENMGRLAKWIERFGGATGLYSDGKELTDFVDG